MESIIWSKVKEPPLRELLILLKNCDSLPELYKVLINFHYLSLKNEFLSKYLLLGKTLEIARELLDTPDNLKNSFKSLPIELREIFKEKDLNWLYSISNSRIETRHAIKKSADNLLHEEMTDEEYKFFLYLSDNLILYLIRKKLGLSIEVKQFG